MEATAAHDGSGGLRAAETPAALTVMLPSSSPSAARSARLPSPTLLVPSSSSPHADSVHDPLLAYHQVITPQSKPTLYSAASSPSPASAFTFAATSDLSTLSSEQRFAPIAIQPDAPTLQSDIFHLLMTLYLPFVLPAAALQLLSAASVTIAPVTGGITNTLFRASVSASSVASFSPPPPVLIRVFGLSTEQVIDRHRETELVMAMSRSGFGIRIHGHFSNGRIEQWLEAQPLQPHTMPEYAQAIGRTVAQLHCQTLPVMDTGSGASVSPLFTTLQRWMQQAMTVSFDSEPMKAAKLRELNVGFWQSSLQSTLQLLQRSRYAQQPLVFCHNDLLAGNILLSSCSSRTDSEPVLHLVDYEYSALNYAAFDIANHFMECCGFQCDMRLFPTEEQRRTLLAAYLHERRRLGRPHCETETELMRSVTAFLLLSHLWWGIWAVVQAKLSTIDFSYLDYSMLRKRGFLQQQHESWTILREDAVQPAAAGDSSGIHTSMPYSSH